MAALTRVGLSSGCTRNLKKFFEFRSAAATSPQTLAVMAPTMVARGSRTTVKDRERSEEEAEFDGFQNQHQIHNADSDKDSVEEELERLVFGDSSGFREGLRSFREPHELSRGKELVVAEGDGVEAAIEDVDDADLFFLDSGSTELPSQELFPTQPSDDEDAGAREEAAWTDSDDERREVSLVDRPLLRKLRKTEAEDVITGKEYSRRLQKQYKILNPGMDWVHSARPRKRRRTSMGSSASDSSSDDEMDIDEDDLSAQPLAKLLQDSDSLTRRTDNGTGNRRKLRPEVIDIQRMKDITASGPSAVTCLQVHNSLPLLISSGPSSNVAIHHLQPQPPNPNPLLTTLHVKKTPMTTTLFHPSADDPRIFLGARRKYFHVWNLASGTVERITRVYGHQDEQRSMESFKLSPDGRYLALIGSARKGGGVINILDADTLQWIAQARVESYGGVADFCWWADSAGICVAGKNGEITEWNLEQRSAVARWNDEGAVGTTTIALGGDSGRETFGGDRWMAIGSSSGIVNIYDRRAWRESIPKNPKPTRVLDQLTTPISHLTFSPDGQLMCMASRWKGDALRLVHLPTCTVYKNWPTGKTPFGRISAVAFGEVDKETIVLVGNEAGKIRGWEIRG